MRGCSQNPFKAFNRLYRNFEQLRQRLEDEEELSGSSIDNDSDGTQSIESLLNECFNRKNNGYTKVVENEIKIKEEVLY